MEEVTATRVCADVRAPFQYVFMLFEEGGEHFMGANVGNAAGRLRTTPPGASSSVCHGNH